MANGGWSCNGLCGSESLVAGVTGGVGPFCFGPPTFFEKLAAFQGVPVIICTEDCRCYLGQIMEICRDYITLNSNGNLLVIPVRQITRLALAPGTGFGFAGELGEAE